MTTVFGEEGEGYSMSELDCFRTFGILKSVFNIQVYGFIKNKKKKQGAFWLECHFNYFSMEQTSKKVLLRCPFGWSPFQCILGWPFLKMSPMASLSSLARKYKEMPEKLATLHREAYLCMQSTIISSQGEGTSPTVCKTLEVPCLRQ